MNDNTHISPKIVTSHHFTSRTSLHYTSLPIFHFLPLLDVSSPPFNNPSLLLTFNYFPNPLSKNTRSTGESRQCLCRQSVPQFDCPIYKALFIDISSLFPGPNFTTLIVPARDGTFNLSTIVFHTRCPVHSLNREKMRAIFLRCAKVSRPKSFV